MFLKNFDFLSYPLTLHYEHYRSHPSIISGFLTLIVYILCIIVSIYLSIDFMFKINPSAYTYNRVISDIGIFFIKEKTFFHFINLLSFEDYKDNIYEIIGLQDVFYSTYYQNGNREEFDHYIYEPCINLNYDYKSINLINKNDIIEFKKSFCISRFYNKTTKKIISMKDNNYIPPNLSHGSSNPNNTFYGIFIQKCVNSSLNNYSCKSQAEIDLFFNNSIGSKFVILNSEIDVSNYKEPFVHSFYSISSSFSSTGFTINNLNFQPLIILSFESYVISIKTEKISYIFEQNSKSNVISEKGIRGCYYFWFQNKAIVYERKYKKLENVFADIGGIIKIFITIGTWINYFFAKYFTLTDINIIIKKYIDLNHHFQINSKYKLSSNLRKKNINNSLNINNNDNDNIDNHIINKSNVSSLNINNENISQNQNIKNQIIYLNNSSSKLNPNYILYKNNHTSQFNNKKCASIVSNPSKIKFRATKKVDDSKKKNFYLKDLFCFICHCSSKKTGKGFYIRLIKKYYEKIISEEEMFYLAYEVNSFRNYIDINNNYHHFTHKRENKFKSKENLKNTIDYNLMIKELSSLFKLN